MFLNPNLETSKPVIQVNEVSYGKATWQYKFDHPNNGTGQQYIQGKQ